MSKNLIVTFTHTNYCLHSSGTEKFVREYSKLIQENNYSNLVFFPIDKRKNRNTIYTCVVFNDRFVGIYRYKDIELIIITFAKKNKMRLHSFCIQHLKNQNLELLNGIISKFSVPVNIVIHDYYSLCLNFRMVDTNNVFCGCTKPTSDKCCNCEMMERGISHYKAIANFYRGIDKFINKIIVPSHYVNCVFSNAFPFLKKHVYVRPHLNFEGVHKKESIKRGDVIRIAYVGAQIADKGFDEWKKIVNSLRSSESPRFEFYYFGFGKEQVQSVSNIYIAGARNEKTMDKFLKDYKIDCGVFWSHCPETYSYVYYEMSLAGVYVLTNDISGNVTDQVRVNKNGKVFTVINNCIDWLMDETMCVTEINNYRNQPAFSPIKSSVNKELCLHNSKGYDFADQRIFRKIKKCQLVTQLYILKHFFNNKGETKMKYFMKGHRDSYENIG